MTNGNATPAQVTLSPRGLRFPATDGEAILDAGRRAGFTFPQACRNGNCYRCEGRLLRGTVEHLRSHEQTRGDAGASGEAPRVLPCIVSAQGDCLLAVEGVYGPGELPVVTVAAQVVAVTALNHNVARVQLRLPAGKKIERLAGHYLEIVDGENAYAFSIASAPESGRELELHVRYGDDNPSSLTVMALLGRERTVTLRLPMGDCTLVGEPRLPLLLIAGATGFSQVKAFVEHAIAQRWQIPVAIYWGARTAADLYLRELAESWAREHANIHFVPVVSGDDATGLPAGTRRGLVHEAVMADAPDTGKLLVYACGSPAMVYAVQDALVARGLPAERVFSDVFAWAPRTV